MLSWLKKAWKWLALGAGILVVTLLSLLRGRDPAQEAAERAQKKVEDADEEARENVERALRSGSFADSLRRDGAGQPRGGSPD